MILVILTGLRIGYPLGLSSIIQPSEAVEPKKLGSRRLLVMMKKEEISNFQQFPLVQWSHDPRNQPVGFDIGSSAHGHSDGVSV